MTKSLFRSMQKHENLGNQNLTLRQTLKLHCSEGCACMCKIAIERAHHCISCNVRRIGRVTESNN